ncbi:MAG: flagellum-specific ATP synthase FliI, partial [Shewanella algae]
MKTNVLAGNWPRVPVAQIYGRLTRVSGLLLEAVGCNLGIGDRAMVERRDGAYVEAEVVGFHQGILCLMPITDTQGLSPGARVIPQTETHKIP